MSFTFGQPSNTGSGGNTPNKPLFGAANTSGGGTTSLFGATSGANPTSGTPGATSTFGSGTSNLFGGGSSSTPAGNKPLFGAPPATSGGQSTSSPFSFGNAGATGAAGTPAAGAAKPLFGAVTGGGASSATTSTTASPFSFGTAAAGSTPAATPAPTKTSFLPSTTPAGPPPGAGNLFGGQKPQAAGNAQAQSLFGAKPASAAPAATTPASNLFGGGNSLANAKPLGSSSGASPLFSLGNKDASADANKPAAPAAAPQGLFGAKPAGDAQATPKPSLFNIGSSTTPSSTPASKPPAFSLGTTPASAQPTGSQPAASTAAPTNTLFSGTGGLGGATGGSGASPFTLNKPAASSAPTASSGAATTTATTTSGTSPFPALGLGGSSAPAASGPASTSSAPSLFSLGGAKPATSGAQPSTSTATTGPASSTAVPAGTTGTDAAKTGAGLAASTAGPAPSAQSRLKNKSMDEIITRWAADLSKYQKEFQQQAETVAQWDRALVENSDKVRGLYSKTFQAERDAAEVERQLTMMEENQQELDSYLDRYEKEIDNLMKMHGVGGRSDGLRGPDQERERTYKLAEKLQDRLNELNKDLTEMIEEINNTSQTLSKTGKPDDPLTKVVRVLNSQLSQLQLIDSGASQLQEKISRAQKESQRVGANGWSGLGTDPAEDFYRSFRGGRTERFGGVS